MMIARLGGEASDRAVRGELRKNGYFVPHSSPGILPERIASSC
jgi:hypothetical protein